MQKTIPAKKLVRLVRFAIENMTFFDWIIIDFHGCKNCSEKSSFLLVKSPGFS
jgi:hypothetical protein